MRLLRLIVMLYRVLVRKLAALRAPRLIRVPDRAAFVRALQRARDPRRFVAVLRYTPKVGADHMGQYWLQLQFLSEDRELIAYAVEFLQQARVKRLPDRETWDKEKSRALRVAEGFTEEEIRGILRAVVGCRLEAIRISEDVPEACQNEAWDWARRRNVAA